MDTIYEALTALIFGGVAGGFVSFVYFKKQVRWESLREAGMLALEVVDSVLSNVEWRDGEGNIIPIVKQPVDVALARKALNQLSLTCENPTVITQYMNVLGLHAPSETPMNLSPDAVIGLRNAIRKELGFSKPVPLDRAFIATLPGHSAG